MKTLEERFAIFVQQIQAEVSCVQQGPVADGFADFSQHVLHQIDAFADSLKTSRDNLDEVYKLYNTLQRNVNECKKEVRDFNEYKTEVRQLISKSSLDNEQKVVLAFTKIEALERMTKANLKKVVEELQSRLVTIENQQVALSDLVQSNHASALQRGETDSKLALMTEKIAALEKRTAFLTNCVGLLAISFGAWVAYYPGVAEQFGF